MLAVFRGGGGPVPGGGRHDTGGAAVPAAGGHGARHHGPGEGTHSNKVFTLTPAPIGEPPERVLLRDRGLGHLLPGGQPRHRPHPALGHLRSVASHISGQ